MQFNFPLDLIRVSYSLTSKSPVSLRVRMWVCVSSSLISISTVSLLQYECECVSLPLSYLSLLSLFFSTYVRLFLFLCVVLLLLPSSACRSRLFSISWIFDHENKFQEQENWKHENEKWKLKICDVPDIRNLILYAFYDFTSI